MFRRLSALILVLLVILPNCSFAFASHYCGGKIVDSSFTFGTQELSCGGSGMNDVCDIDNPFNSSEYSRVQALPCCDNRKVFLDVEDRYHAEPSFALDNLSFNVFIASFPKLLVSQNQAQNIYGNAHAPPDANSKKIHFIQVYRL